jgi:hypothetical protein
VKVTALNNVFYYIGDLVWILYAEQVFYAINASRFGNTMKLVGIIWNVVPTMATSDIKKSVEVVWVYMG